MLGTMLFVTANVLLGILSLLCLIWLFGINRQNKSSLVLLIVLITGSVALVFSHILNGDNVSLIFYRWVFNMDEDRNIPAIFSALLWIILGILFFRRGNIKGISLLQRGFWVSLAILMFFLGIDDYYAIHEILIYTWRNLYKGATVVIGIVVLGAFFAWMWQDFKKYPQPFIIIAIGSAMLVFSGLMLEELMYATCKGSFEVVFCANYHNTTAWEEFYELLSIIVIIGGFMTYLRTISSGQWRYTMRILVIVSIIVIVGFVGYMYPLPELEERLLAQPLDIQYGDELRFRGYWVSDPDPQPGDRVYMIFYWQTPNRLYRDYHLSVHLLSNPDFQSYAQADRIHIGQIPSRAWLPNQTVRGAIYIDIPEDIPTLASYLVSVRVWYGDSIWDGRASHSQGLNITESSHLQMDEETVFITHLPIISEQQEILSLTTQSHFQFTNGITLAGYTLPDVVVTGTALNMVFHWQADRNIDEPLTQFIHLVSADGETIILDRQPFDSRLLTEDWTANLNHTDQAQSLIASDIKAGIYHVYMGLYNSSTGQRISVINGNGQPLSDGIIELGLVDIQAADN